MDSNSINRQPEFTDEHGDIALRCPNCGGAWLHQEGVSIFNRHTEDSEQGLSVKMNYGDGSLTVDEDTTADNGNPSSRRDGIRVQFSCEQCSNKEPKFELVIEQHKGNEFVHWEEIQ